MAICHGACAKGAISSLLPIPVRPSSDTFGKQSVALRKGVLSIHNPTTGNSIGSCPGRRMRPMATPTGKNQSWRSRRSSTNSTSVHSLRAKMSVPNHRRQGRLRRTEHVRPLSIIFLGAGVRQRPDRWKVISMPGSRTRLRRYCRFGYATPGRSSNRRVLRRFDACAMSTMAGRIS